MEQPRAQQQVFYPNAYSFEINNGNIRAAEDYLVWSVINIICFWPLSIVAIIFSIEVRDLNRQGSPLAIDKSKTVLKINKIATALGVLIYSIPIILILIQFFIIIIIGLFAAHKN